MTKQEAKLTIVDPKKLLDCFDAIGGLVIDVNLKVNQEGIEMAAMDPAAVAMVVFKMKQSNFVEYEVKEDILAGFAVQKLKDVLKRAKPGDSARMHIGDEIKVELFGKSKKNFTIPLINIEDKQQKVPELTFKGKAQVDIDEFSDALEDMLVVVQDEAGAQFVAEGGKLKLSVQDQAQSADSIVQGAIMEMGKEKVIKCKYSIQYLQKILKAKKINDKAKLEFSTNYPMRMDFSTDKVQLAFILAPRVENSDDDSDKASKTRDGDD